MEKKEGAATKKSPAAGTWKECLGSINQPNVHENKNGPMTKAMERKLLIAPCNSPCSCSLTWCVMIPCAAGKEIFHIEITGIDAMYIAPLRASPAINIPTAPKNWPT